MKESKLSKDYIKWLNSLPKTKAMKRYAGPGRKGQLDITGCSHGYRLEIEVKIGDNKPTLKQEWWMIYWQRTGAIVFWDNNLKHLKNKFLIALQDKGIFIK
jgi:hypothetical protein